MYMGIIFHMTMIKVRIVDPTRIRTKRIYFFGKFNFTLYSGRNLVRLKKIGKTIKFSWTGSYKGKIAPIILRSTK